MAKQRTKSSQPPQTKPSDGPKAPQSELQNALYSKDIASLAYQLWQSRGCPEGSPDVDWLEAEKQLRRQHSEDAAPQNREPLLVRGSGA